MSETPGADVKWVSIEALRVQARRDIATYKLRTLADVGLDPCIACTNFILDTSGLKPDRLGSCGVASPAASESERRDILASSSMPPKIPKSSAVIAQYDGVPMACPDIDAIKDALAVRPDVATVMVPDFIIGVRPPEITK